MEQSLLRMVIGIKDSISWVNFMGKANIFGSIILVMKDNLKVVWEMVKVYGNLVTALVTPMKVNTKMIWNMDLVYMFGPMDLVLREHLKMIESMERVLLSMKMVKFLNCSGRMET